MHLHQVEEPLSGTNTESKELRTKIENAAPTLQTATTPGTGPLCVDPWTLNHSSVLETLSNNSSKKCTEGLYKSVYGSPIALLVERV
jgi:hypothetical protein